MGSDIRLQACFWPMALTLPRCHTYSDTRILALRLEFIATLYGERQNQFRTLQAAFSREDKSSSMSPQRLHRLNSYERISACHKSQAVDFPTLCDAANVHTNARPRFLILGPRVRVTPGA